MSTCPYEPRDDSRPCQGSLYRDIKAIVSAKPTLVPREIDFSEWAFPYAVTLSQECDLVQDHKIRTQKGSEHTRKNDDKLIPTILMCPAYPSNPFRDGRHLQALKWEMERQNSKAW
ncbi:MAG: hypothetical protein KAV87_18505, partial [Desulfobacteraceae bacterium]|nr:hypothetical protein [Desulfobacteraceae bacterium]